MRKFKWHKSSVIITLTVILLSMLLFLTPLDSKFFDLFLRVLPSLTENDKVYVLTLDDDSISYAGGFPFRREVMADVVVLLKEIGVNSIAFDLSYLDESPQRLDPAYAADFSTRGLDSFFGRLNEAAEQAIEAAAASRSTKDKDSYKADIRKFHRNMRYEMEDSLSLLTRDVDEYFAQALAFSGCSWLTLTMISPEEIMELGEGESSAASNSGNSKIDKYLADSVSIKNIDGSRDSKTKDMAMVMPAIQKLLSRSEGAGFVNAYPDSDGLRRRINLLTKYHGDYYGHLALMAIQKKLGWTSIEISGKKIILNMNENDPDGKTLKVNPYRKLIIPRTQDGSILLKWPKKSFYDYKLMSLIQLIQYTVVEPVFAENIALMHNSGFFDFWDYESDYQNGAGLELRACHNVGYFCAGRNAENIRTAACENKQRQKA